jgi:uncharacterized membrane protein
LSRPAVAARGLVCQFGLDTRRSTMRVRRLIGYVPQQLSIDGQHTLAADFAALLVATVVGIAGASLLLGRLAR